MWESWVEVSYNAGCMKELNVDKIKLGFLKGFWMGNVDLMHFWDHEGYEGWHGANVPCHTHMKVSLYQI